MIVNGYCNIHGDLVALFHSANLSKPFDVHVSIVFLRERERIYDMSFRERERETTSLYSLYFQMYM